MYMCIDRSMSYAKLLIDGYMICTYFIASSLIHYSVVLADKNGRLLNVVIWLIPILFAVLHVAGFMVEDYRHTGIALVRIEGGLYFLFETYAIASCVAAALILQGARRSGRENKARCEVALIGILPYVLISITVIALMRFYPNVSPAMWLPVAGVFFLLITMLATEIEALDLAEHLIYAKSMFQKHHRALFDRRRPLPERIQLLEKIAIEEALRQSGGSQKDAAQALGISAPGLSNKIKKYDIPFRDSRRTSLSEEKSLKW